MNHSRQGKADFMELSKKVKYLEEVLDNTLNFESYISLNVQKAMTNFIKIKSVCKYITREACTTMVLMLCTHLDLDYSNGLLHRLPNKTIKRCQIIQNICAKLVLGRSGYSSSNEALKCLHWLPIQQKITYQIGLLTFKCISKAAPKYLQELITNRKPMQKNMHSNNTGPILEIPKIKQNICSKVIQICCTNSMEFIPKLNKNM